MVVSLSVAFLVLASGCGGVVGLFCPGCGRGDV